MSNQWRRTLQSSFPISNTIPSPIRIDFPVTESLPGQKPSTGAECCWWTIGNLSSGPQFTILTHSWIFCCFCCIFVLSFSSSHELKCALCWGCFTASHLDLRLGYFCFWAVMIIKYKQISSKSKTRLSQNCTIVWMSTFFLSDTINDFLKNLR